MPSLVAILRVLKYPLFLFVAAGVALAFDGRAVFIRSEESKTMDGDPVFNKIKWIIEPNRDIWMMNQSHHGEFASAEQWDRVAIIVDNTVSPRTARFYQLPTGALEWQNGLQPIPYKASCYMCHANGPRAIRPDQASLIDRLKIGLWNLRIKTYGRVVLDKYHDETDASLHQPVRYRDAFDNEPLMVATCVKCHNDSHFPARGYLRRQNIPTIKFMITNGHMPPLGFSLPPHERLELRRFVAGF